MKFKGTLIWFFVFILIVGCSALIVNTGLNTHKASADTKSASPDTKAASPGTKPATPDTKPATPDTKAATPDNKAASPDNKTATPDTKARTPDTKGTTPETNAATPRTETATPDTKAASPGVKAADISMRVKGITGKLTLDNTITVDVENLQKFLEQPGKDFKKFILYLDWRPLKGLNVRLVDDTDKLLFDIRRTADSKDQWNALLGSPDGWTRNVPVSIGYENQKPIDSDVESYPLHVVKKGWVAIFIAFFLFVFGLFIWFANHTHIIREPSDQSSGQKPPFSLGRTQMAFWFFIIAISFVCIWMVTGDLDSITESALGLMGISAATALGAGVVDSSKRNEAENTLQNLEKEQKTLTERLQTLPAEIAAKPVSEKGALENEKANKDAQLTQVTTKINDLTATLAPKPSKGFLTDMVSDVNGISLHRFQIFIWTIALGIIFLYTMYQSLAMPQFSGTLLALMGISSGTYIGFKFPEKKN